ncbi:MAG TPA: hypothetical protein VK449_09390, partial [Anaerolineales bacterium]|nr:hypothetical protein [Anaerolineales bacterium]
MVTAERVNLVAREGHAWWTPLHLSFVPGIEHPVLHTFVPEFLEHLAQTGHEIQDRPGPTTNLLLTTARFGEPVPWRQSLLLAHRRAFGLKHSPTIVTLAIITPQELAQILDRLATALAKEPPDQADFRFPGLTERAHRVLIEQGLRGGPMLSLLRLVQSQAICIRTILLVADDRPRQAYYFDLVGAHPRVDFVEAGSFYEDMARRLATAASTHEVTQHRIETPPFPAEVWPALETPQAMMRASLEFGARSFFTEMVRVSDLVNVPGLAEAISTQYSEGCFATWEPRLPALMTTITGSARPVDKGRITEDELALIVGVRPDGSGAIVRHVEGHGEIAPSSEAVEMIRMDAVLPRIRLPDGTAVPVLRSKLHGHRGVAAFDPARVEFAPLDLPYYRYPVSCSTEAQAVAMERAFGRARSLRD